MKLVFPKVIQKFQYSIQDKIYTITLKPFNYYIFPDFFFKDYEKHFQPYTYSVKEIKTNINREIIENKKYKNIIIVRTGGYGDIIALTSIAKFLKDKNPLCNIYIYTASFRKSLKYILPDYIKLKSVIEDPISNYTLKNSHFIIFEGIIEKEKNKNWYDLFFEILNYNPAKISPSYKIPQLKLQLPNILLNKIIPLQNLIKKYYSEKRFLIFFNLKTTSPIRNFRVIDIIPVLSKYVNLKTTLFILSISNLTDSDKYYIQKNPDFLKKYPVIILEFQSFEEYLVLLYYVDLVISSDTFALHYREGIKKPAIGLFNSFPKEVRTKYYIYTKSYNILYSDCPYQFCQRHTPFTYFIDNENKIKIPLMCQYLYEDEMKHNSNILNQYQNIYDLKDISPCALPYFNKTLIFQLEKIFADYFKDI